MDEVKFQYVKEAVEVHFTRFVFVDLAGFCENVKEWEFFQANVRIIEILGFRISLYEFIRSKHPSLLWKPDSQPEAWQKFVKTG